MNRFPIMKKKKKKNHLLSCSVPVLAVSGNPKDSSKYHFQRSTLFFLVSEIYLPTFRNLVVGDFLNQRVLKQLLLSFCPQPPSKPLSRKIDN